MKTGKLTIASNIVFAALVAATASTFIFGVGNANALNLGNVITKYDGVGGGSGTFKEENEAEPGMVQSQVWDLEGFLLKGKTLSVVGGYNLYTGQENMKSGDIFIDTNGDAVYAPNTIPGFNYNPGYKEVSNSLFRYDYVVDVEWTLGTYKVVKLTADSVLQDTEYGATYNTPSNPWRYVSGGNVISSGSIEDIYRGALVSGVYKGVSYSDAETGFDGWAGTNGAGKHYVASFDISSIDLSNGALFHNTMECGNDNLIGQSAPVPEPSTFMLLGAGLLGAALYRRKKQQ